MCCNVWLTSLFTASRSDWLNSFSAWMGFFCRLMRFLYLLFKWMESFWVKGMKKLSYELTHRTARISWSNNGLPEGFETYFHAFIFSCKQKLVPKPSAMTYPRIVSYRLKSHLQSLCTPALKTCLNSNDCTSPLYLRTDFLADLNWWQADAKIGSTRV